MIKDKNKKKVNRKETQQFIFGKRNYVIMFIGVLFIALGFILMAGGGSDDPNIFNPEIFNFRKIRLAPTLVLIGLGIQFYAILIDSKKKS